MDSCLCFFIGEHDFVLQGAISTPFLNRDMIIRVTPVNTLFESSPDEGSDCVTVFAKYVLLIFI